MAQDKSASRCHSLLWWPAPPPPNPCPTTTRPASDPHLLCCETVPPARPQWKRGMRRAFCNVACGRAPQEAVVESASDHNLYRLWGQAEKSTPHPFYLHAYSQHSHPLSRRAMICTFMDPSSCYSLFPSAFSSSSSPYSVSSSK